RPPGLLPATRRAGRGVLPVLRGRRFLPARPAARVGGGVRAGGGGDGPLAAAHPGGAGSAAAGDPARSARLPPQALAAVASRASRRGSLAGSPRPRAGRGGGRGGGGGRRLHS